MPGTGTNTYSWDARNHLSTISQGRTTVGSFVYDGFGRRMKKTIGGVTTEFLYDGLNPVQELDGANPPNITANLLTGLGIDERFTRTDAGGPRDFMSDTLGSTIAPADANGTPPDPIYRHDQCRSSARCAPACCRSSILTKSIRIAPINVADSTRSGNLRPSAEIQILVD